MATKEYIAPKTLEEVMTITAGIESTLLAGGTDLQPRWSKHLAPRPASIVDLKGIDQLHGIQHIDGEVSIGACTLISELESNPVIVKYAPMLSQACGRIACPQIRNRATIGGNLCNASPAADTAIPLILFDATLDLTSANSNGVVRVRKVPVTDFFHGPGVTELKRGEVLTRIHFTPTPGDCFTAWDKFGTRPSMEIAVATVGVVIKLVNDVVIHTRIGYGSVAPTPIRGFKAEEVLIGCRLNPDVIDHCINVAREEISPITDVRASDNYRRHIVGVMLRRMLENAANAY